MNIHLAEAHTQEVEALLLGLGQTRFSVAANLMTAGVRGLRNRAIFCPLVAYMDKHGFEGQTDGQYFTTHDGEVVARLPMAVRNFVGDFDRGLFPSLDAKAPAKIL